MRVEGELNMTIHDVLKEQYGLQEGDYLHHVEVETARICTRMSRQDLLFDYAGIDKYLHSLYMEYGTIAKEFRTITKGEFGRLPRRYSNEKVIAYLEQYGLDTSVVSSYKHPYQFNSWKSKVLGELEAKGKENLTDNEKHILYVLEFLKKEKDLTEKIKSITNAYEKIDPYDHICKVIFSSQETGIKSERINLVSTGFEEYIIPSKGKKLLKVIQSNSLLNVVINLLDNDWAKEWHSKQDKQPEFLSVLYGIDVSEVTEDHFKIFLSFVHRVSLERSADLLKMLRFFEMYDKTNEQVSKFVDDLFSLSKDLRVKEYSPYGAKKYVGRTARAIYTDTIKSGLVSIVEKVEKVTPRFVVRDYLYFEVDKTEDLDNIKRQIEEAYQSAFPNGWIKPSIKIEVK